MLTENNYERWSKLMRNSLKAKNKLGFIDGVITEPEGVKELKKWGIVNSMLVAWILNTIEPELRGSVSCAETAHQLWTDIRERFSVDNEPRIYELQAAFNSYKQEKQTVQDYYAKMKLMWDAIDEFEPLMECCCGGKSCKVIKALIEQRDKQRRRQFLMGLDAGRFGNVRSNILCMSPPPNLNAVFSMIIRCLNWFSY
ncbi:hypothetical protein EUTSA_v10003063mg [Eutrema salsugineum]|uniref:Retrotransposon Copia-like N-terminal domain-containing protein n=1 Tax=Eutrema salsugineum TaxID=72664 RepID=V4L106_EUTSA|nr:hypothetical protein EUTSA_v10003063mg [Eutrema salsugineum]